MADGLTHHIDQLRQLESHFYRQFVAASINSMRAQLFLRILPVIINGSNESVIAVEEKC